MIKSLLKKLFDIREGELHIALLMQGYIFLIIATLLIIKPTVNSIFLSDLGAENLPFAFLLVAIAAIVTSYFYAKISERFSLLHIIRFTLIFSIVSLIVLGTLLHLHLIKGWVLYAFYTGVAIYAVLATSQFWVLANLVFNVRQAKRLFGFIGAGAIVGGIFGGYLTTLLAPFVGNENLIFIAAFFLMMCFPILGKIWRSNTSALQATKQRKTILGSKESAFKLVLRSKHLSYLAVIIAIGVLTARLVDYQFSSIASQKIKDSDELTSFFGFWLSTFNLISLVLQLFLTRKIVGVWGVGFSLLLLPVLIFLGGTLFFMFPELWVIILLKATDGSLKQSVNKSAVELIALPLPFQLKKKTKSFIDVVVDSIATGIAGCILIFLIKGLDVPPKYIMGLILMLTLVWTYFVLKVRKEYFLSFRRNLTKLHPNKEKETKSVTKESFLKGMQRVFSEGKEKEILFMLEKYREINDKRLEKSIIKLLDHESNAVKASAIRTLYFFNSKTIHLEVVNLLKTEDDEVVMAALEYLLLHADKNESIIFDTYLNHPSDYVSGAALVCLAKESRVHNQLKVKYRLFDRIEEKATQLESFSGIEKEKEHIELLRIIGLSRYSKSYSYIIEGLTNTTNSIKNEAYIAAGTTGNEQFIDALLEGLKVRTVRVAATKGFLLYGNDAIDLLIKKIKDPEYDIDIKRLIPKVISSFNTQEAVNALLNNFIVAEDLTVRLHCVKELTRLKYENPDLYFDNKKVAKLILEECKLYNAALNAMHTQIIVHYLRRKKIKPNLSSKEIEARESLMELLERRLDNGLERIFKLLELRYTQKDVRSVYEGITSPEQEKRTNAIEFLDLLLNQDLKSALIPIVEATILDTSSEEVISSIARNKFTEYECFQSILEGKDLKLKLAVLYLISELKDDAYTLLVSPLTTNEDFKIRSYAKLALENISKIN